MKFLLPILLIFFTTMPSTTLAQDEKLNLTNEEKKILEVGHIPDAQYIAGGVLGTFPGFGIGHAVQGRWKDTGWIFTAGEVGAMSLMMIGGMSCMSNHMRDNMNRSNDGTNCSDLNKAFVFSGMLTFLGFKVWETVDVWTVPPRHNLKFKDIQERRQESKEVSRSSLFVSPILNRDTGNGIGMFFSF